MKLKSLGLLIPILLVSCASSEKSARSKQGLIVGKNDSSVKVMIRQIDDGRILWLGKDKLGTSASITWGQHSVSVICEFKGPLETKILPGKTELEVLQGVTYRLNGSPSDDNTECIVEVNT